MPLQSVDFPSRGAVVAKELGPRNGLPPYVLNATLDHAAGPGFLGSAYSPFWVRSDPSSPDFRIDDLEIPLDMDWSEISDRRWLVKRLDARFRERDTKGLFSDRERFFQEAESIIRSPAVKTAFDISTEPEGLRNRYGRTPLGQGCLLARRLVEGGVRFVTINAARAIWDTHSDNFNRCEKVLLPEFDAAFATLMEDMHQRGLLESTLVVGAGEFGRNAEGQPECRTRPLAQGVLRGARGRRRPGRAGVRLVRLGRRRAQRQSRFDGGPDRNDLRPPRHRSRQGIPHADEPPGPPGESRQAHKVPSGLTLGPVAWPCALVECRMEVATHHPRLPQPGITVCLMRPDLSFRTVGSGTLGGALRSQAGVAVSGEVADLHAQAS